ncbi:Trehalose transport system permease protein SugA [Oceanobacillus oncorhynchi]|uniref:Trehalose transport system permease protein SugA n=1 Tax=Oceanobacillus oncorhynchi TaxID=545501 RepID=A0A0A1MDJ0_9BACI|nr:sugar ABC transporter permease [Oceanobacillus oncorhynchi]CEI81158.1 Trehalose transport system permease protein SugA [Oceanobacillus oncorhynchi]
MSNRTKNVNQQPLHHRPWKKNVPGYLMVLPAFLVLAAIMFYPIFYTIRMSLNNVDISSSGYIFDFIGLQHYIDIFTNSVYWDSIWLTFYFAFVTVAVEIVLGLLIALAINKVKRLLNVSLVVMLIPWALITVVSGQMWSYIYNAVYGVLNYVLETLHLIDSPIAWLATPDTAVISMMIAEIWKTTPFVVIILLAGLQMVPKDQYEAASMDGANVWQQFWKITLPAIKGSIAVSIIFRLLQAFGVFDLPFVLTGGGPGNATQPVAMLAQKSLFQNLNFGLGSAISVSVVFFIIMLSITFYPLIRSVVKGES